jgi:hypothetical protein
MGRKRNKKMTNEKFERILAHLNNALVSFQTAKAEAGEDKLSPLGMLIDKTEEAIHRWKFREGK